ncbi:long-chain fatty acid--CoA ligase [Mycolicibacterium smegmatis]|nr:long-chain fatty acid--CoA ligase [Mycolicibacterium smegmatis]MDF1903240.1 long-chain fatty acid--CoA ligase [Mycolicibacterium smegmatis]MDF1909843.1 long-chain fatty acid--CoA ligase [Mycolicibacterium smegmatis]MDF1921755.1 long-chain fatty acid--CoA ligase [Mycolicibacterium smegmatis]MDF1928151.1 long-chain fatty acid--CoA ligase [Mycolicibacterium smegmatis]UGT78882.1 long-chain fatty acid--CoA ligase [Mycolicibacterium smegmatis]
MYLTQGLHRAVQQTPGATMTVFGERRRTFLEVADRVARLAGALRALGVRAGDRVAMLAQNSDRYHEYLLAVPWANGVLNPVNIRWTPAEIAYSLEDSGTKVMFVDDSFARMLPAIKDAWAELSTVIYAGEASPPAGTLAYEELIDKSDPVDDARRGGDELAGLFYTGGTTGFPKGVMLSHANLLTSTYGLLTPGFAFRPGGICLHAAPMFHLADLMSWSAGLLQGGRHVFIPSFEPVTVMQAIAQHQVTDALLVPTMIQKLIDHPDINRYDLTSFRALFYAASAIPQALLERAMKVFPNAEFVQGYGMTELSPLATLLSPDDHQKPRLLRSAGRAAPSAEVRIVDPDGNEVPRRTVGEVAVRGGNVMLGYWNKPQETAAAIRDGWMHTGDAAYMDDDGYIYVVDRIKDMIITGGENVYSAEVENAVVQHPSVAACAVIGVPDADWGERVHAVVVLQPGAELAACQIREHAKRLIAGYKCPRSIEFVNALPLSGAGKVLKRELRERHLGARER